MREGQNRTKKEDEEDLAEERGYFFWFFFFFFFFGTPPYVLKRGKKAPKRGNKSQMYLIISFVHSWKRVKDEGVNADKNKTKNNWAGYSKCSVVFVPIVPKVANGLGRSQRVGLEESPAGWERTGRDRREGDRPQHRLTGPSVLS